MNLQKKTCLIDILNTPILVTIAGDRFFRAESQLTINVTTESKIFEYTILPGFVTDFRSGGPLVDIFIQQFGTDLMQAAYICHDVAYTPIFVDGIRKHQIEKSFADLLLEQMLIYAKVKKWKAKLIFLALKLFGKRAYMNDNEFSVENSKKYNLKISNRNI